MGQGEIGDPHDIEGHQTSQGHDGDDNEVISGGKGPSVGAAGPSMMVQAWVMMKQKVMFTKMIKHLETQWEDHVHPEDLGVGMDLKDPRTCGASGPCVLELACQMPILFSRDDGDAEGDLL